jgi:hypothetical protein
MIENNPSPPFQITKTMKTHKIRHNGRESEVVDADTARGLLEALENAATELEFFGHMEATDAADAAIDKVNQEPEPEPRQPLEAADIPPGSVVRMLGWPDWSWEAVTEVWPDRVMLSRPAKMSTYLQLMDRGYQIKRPGEGWKPCSKPGDVE